MNIESISPQQLANLYRTKKRSDKDFIPEPYKKVAKDYETQFAQFMLEKMNQTATGEKEVSSAENYYRSLQTEERAKILTNNRGGLGIQDLILDQIYPKRLRNEMAYKYYQKQNGLSQNESSIIKGAGNEQH